MNAMYFITRSESSNNQSRNWILRCRSTSGSKKGFVCKKKLVFKQVWLLFFEVVRHSFL